ncbi:MAG: hypothetical protein ACRDH2_09110 [Anaerolineales bacterium]
MKPIVHGLEAQYGDRIQFTYLDMDDPRTDGLKKQLGFVWRPHFLLLDGEGEIVQQWVGAVREEDLVSAFEEALQ